MHLRLPFPVQLIAFKQRTIKMQTLKSLLTVTTLAILLTACGWHLRGQVDVPVAFRILNVDVSKVDFISQNAIKQSMLSNGITLADDAPFTLVVLDEAATRRALAVTSNAKASEYELSQSLTFVLQNSEGQVVSDELEVVSYQTLQYDAEAEIGKAQEEQNLRIDMKQANAYKMLLRLKAVKLKPIESEPAAK
jgi:LPS-assembly lipoprotein